MKISSCLRSVDGTLDAEVLGDLGELGDRHLLEHPDVELFAAAAFGLALGALGALLHRYRAFGRGAVVALLAVDAVAVAIPPAAAATALPVVPAAAAGSPRLPATLPATATAAAARLTLVAAFTRGPFRAVAATAAALARRSRGLAFDAIAFATVRTSRLIFGLGRANVGAVLGCHFGGGLGGQGFVIHGLAHGWFPKWALNVRHNSCIPSPVSADTGSGVDPSFM